MIVAINDLAAIRTRHSDQKIILTSGTYDLFHVGHLRYLTNVKSMGDIVVVMVGSDHRARARKGPGRPIIPEAERAEILDALKVVDYVFIDPSELPPDHIDPVHAEIAARLQPDLHVTYCDDIRFSMYMSKSKNIIVPRTNLRRSSTGIIADILTRYNAAQKSNQRVALSASDAAEPRRIL